MSPIEFLQRLRALGARRRVYPPEAAPPCACNLTAYGEIVHLDVNHPDIAVGIGYGAVDWED